MKKIYILIMAVAFGTAVNAQIDLSISMDNHANLSATSDDPLVLDFTVTNNGVALTDQDTIYFGVNIGADYYTTTGLVSGLVSATTITGGLPNAASFLVDVEDLDMQWIYGELGSLTGTVCVAVIGVGDSVLTTLFSSDDTPLDNVACVNYTVTAVAGIVGNDLTTINAYPNPAINQINFDLGNNEIDNIQILDISGRIVANIAVTGSIESLNVSDYQSGIYFYQMVHKGEVVKTDKFVVSK